MGGKRGHIVVIDDDKQMRGLLQDFLVAEQYEVTCFPSAIEALRALLPGGALEAEKGPDVDVLISDIQMAHLDGMQFLKQVRVERPEIPLILVTAFASVDSAVEALRNGAYDYIVKPFKLAELSLTISHAVDRRQLDRDNHILRQEIKNGWGRGKMLGKSPAMKLVFDLISRVAQSATNVLITGESGTGKEMVARAIHDWGARSSKPFVAINCAAIPEALLESELFGHAKGSFTGAMVRKTGLIEEANGGTLFLDEIGDMTPSLQSKLLRVLQERKIRAVGDTQFSDVDVRVIAATHKNLKQEIREGRFREDLYYRLSVIPVVIPPLRDRKEDIPILAEHFLKKYAAASGSRERRVRGFSKDALAKLLSLSWPGNVRELENAVERAVVLCPGTLVEAEQIGEGEGQSVVSKERGIADDLPTLAKLEERYIDIVMRAVTGRKDKASQILGINRRTLYRKEREYGWVESDSPEPGDSVSSFPASEGALIEIV